MPARDSEKRMHRVYELPVILVDDTHFHRRRTGNKAEMYKIPAGPGFILDATGYTFRTLPDLKGKPPNLIQLVCGLGQIYGLPWQEGKTKYIFTGDNLKPARGCVRLRSFESGEVLMLAIGRYIHPQGPKDEGQFFPYWTSMIYVY